MKSEVCLATPAEAATALKHTQNQHLFANTRAFTAPTKQSPTSKPNNRVPQVLSPTTVIKKCFLINLNFRIDREFSFVEGIEKIGDKIFRLQKIGEKFFVLLKEM